LTFPAVARLTAALGLSLAAVCVSAQPACKPVEAGKLPTVTIAPGVTATLSWGRGALLERVEMRPDAVYPSQTLGEELIVIAQEGSATIEFDGKTAELTKDHVLYLQPGSVRSVKAGAKGCCCVPKAPRPGPPTSRRSSKAGSAKAIAWCFIIAPPA
jgi:quercetin dioxygenase-like cupin family protein